MMFRDLFGNASAAATLTLPSSGVDFHTDQINRFEDATEALIRLDAQAFVQVIHAAVEARDATNLTDDQCEHLSNVIGRIPQQRVRER